MLQTALPTVSSSGSAPSLDRRKGIPATGSRRRIAGRCRQHKTASSVAPLIPARVEKHSEDEQADGQQKHSYHTRPHQSEFTPGLTTLHYTHRVSFAPPARNRAIFCCLPCFCQHQAAIRSIRSSTSLLAWPPNGRRKKLLDAMQFQRQRSTLFLKMFLFKSIRGIRAATFLVAGGVAVIVFSLCTYAKEYNAFLRSIDETMGYGAEPSFTPDRPGPNYPDNDGNYALWEEQNPPNDTDSLENDLGTKSKDPLPYKSSRKPETTRPSPSEKL
jgi:hypothetical protein